MYTVTTRVVILGDGALFRKMRICNCACLKKTIPLEKCINSLWCTAVAEATLNLFQDGFVFFFSRGL
jgi:hypothetical protein